MSEIWTNKISDKKMILVDYTALFETGRFPVLDDLANICVAQNIQVVICSSFLAYHECVLHTGSTSDHFLIAQTNAFIEKVSKAGLLKIEETMSLFSVFLAHVLNKDVCLLAGENAPILYHINKIKESGDISIIVFDHVNASYYPNLTTYINKIKEMEVNSVTTSPDYLDNTSYCNVGDSVFTPEGEEVILTVKINTGAEGLVFRTNNENVVVKIYHRGVLTPLRWMKLVRMTSMGLHAQGICWPTHLLYNVMKEPVGFSMPTAEGYTLGSVFDGPDAMMDRFPDWNRLSVTQATCQVLEKIIYLHLHGILIGDLQLKNIMIKSPAEVFLIDMDSVQLDDFPCPVGTEDFTAPELWDQSFSTFLREPMHEDYSCGILVFSMLFCGQHPYNQRQGRETLREEISARAFPYSTSIMKNAGIPLGGYDKIWESISPEMRNMFCSAFSDGVRYETIAWYAAILTYRDQLVANALIDCEAYRLFPYNSLEIPVQSEGPSSYKKSIRDAVIHSPDLPLSNNEKNMETPERVMYNGRRIGVAFVNQDKLQPFENYEIENGTPANETRILSAEPAISPTPSTPKESHVSNVSALYPLKPIPKSHKKAYRLNKTELFLLGSLIVVIVVFIVFICIL